MAKAWKKKHCQQQQQQQHWKQPRNAQLSTHCRHACMMPITTTLISSQHSRIDTPDASSYILPTTFFFFLAILSIQNKTLFPKNERSPGYNIHFTYASKIVIFFPRLQPSERSSLDFSPTNNSKAAKTCREMHTHLEDNKF